MYILYLVYNTVLVIRIRTSKSSHVSRQKRQPSVSWARQRKASEIGSSPGPWLQLTGSQTTRRSAAMSLV